MQESDIKPEDVIDETEDEKKKTDRHEIRMTAPRQELEKIKKDFNITSDSEATIVYNILRKRPDLMSAVRRVEYKKSSKSLKDDEKKGVYIPEGVETMINQTSEISAELLRDQVRDLVSKAKSYEEEKMAPPPPLPKNPLENVVTEHVKEALQTDKIVREKALKKLLTDEDETKKQPDLKTVVSSALEEKLSKQKSPDERLLEDIKNEIHTEIIKKLKGDTAVKLTPEVIGQIVNSISTLVEKFEPLLNSINTKANVTSTQMRLATIADVHRIIQEQNLRTFKEMMFLVKENKETLENPIMKSFLDSLTQNSSLILDLVKSELSIPSAEQSTPKRTIKPEEI